VSDIVLGLANGARKNNVATFVLGYSSSGFRVNVLVSVTINVQFYYILVKKVEASSAFKVKKKYLIVVVRSAKPFVRAKFSNSRHDVSALLFERSPSPRVPELQERATTTGWIGLYVMLRISILMTTVNEDRDGWMTWVSTAGNSVSY